MVSFESGPETQWDFWANDFKSHLPSFKNEDEEIEQSMCINEEEDWIFNHSEIHRSECTPLSMGRWMSQVNGLIYQNGNLDLASFDQNGNPAPNKRPKFPLDLEFIPNRSVLKRTNGNNRFYKQLVNKANNNVSPGDVLFTVNAREIQDDGTLSDFQEIGNIIQGEAEWTESLWGDERLFFSHGFMPND